MTYRKFSKRQLLAMTWWNRPGLGDRDAIICDGSIRAGKTLAMSCGFFLWSMTRFHGAVFALCGKTIGSLRRNVILHLNDWLGGMMRITEHRAENKLVVRLGSRVNTYYLFGGQDEGSYMLIQGITLAGVLLFAPCCRDAIREFGLYCWEDDDARDTPKKENDHTMDDIRYFCMTVMAR